MENRYRKLERKAFVFKAWIAWAASWWRGEDYAKWSNTRSIEGLRVMSKSRLAKKQQRKSLVVIAKVAHTMVGLDLVAFICARSRQAAFQLGETQ